jgi:hypothetical protein
MTQINWEHIHQEAIGIESKILDKIIYTKYSSLNLKN